MFGGCVITWLIVFLGVLRGPKSLGICGTMTATLPFIFLFVCMAGFVGLNANPTGAAVVNDDDAGEGMSYYWGYEKFPLPDEDVNGKTLYYDPSE